MRVKDYRVSSAYSQSLIDACVTVTSTGLPVTAQISKKSIEVHEWPRCGLLLVTRILRSATFSAGGKIPSFTAYISCAHNVGSCHYNYMRTSGELVVHTSINDSRNSYT